MVSPLNSFLPIVDPKTGRPTPQFLQFWQEQLAVNAKLNVFDFEDDETTVEGTLNVTYNIAALGDIASQDGDIWTLNGNFGAGTDTPEDGLHIAQDGAFVRLEDTSTVGEVWRVGSEGGVFKVAIVGSTTDALTLTSTTATINTDFDVTGDATVGGTFDVTGNATVGGALDVDLDLDVAGAGIFGDDVSVDGNLDVTGTIGTFTQLTDAPTAYTGHGGKAVTVKADESGLEFTPVSGGGGGGGVMDMAAFDPIDDAESWTSEGTVDPTAISGIEFYADNTVGAIGWTFYHFTADVMMMAAPTKNPTSGADFDFVFRIDMRYAAKFPEFLGIYVQNSATGRLTSFGLFNTVPRWYTQNWTNTTFSSETDVNQNSQVHRDFRGYLRVVRDGANITYYSSINGVVWLPHSTVTLASWLVDVDQVGLFHRTVGYSYCSVTLWGLNDDGPQDPG